MRESRWKMKGVGAALFLAVGLALTAAKTTPPEGDSVDGAKDKITLKGGKTLEGDLLDITEQKMVLLAGGKKTTFARGEVLSIQRAAPERILLFVQKNFEKNLKDGSLEDWKKLAEFCSSKKLLPERQNILREIVRLEPGNTAARIELGQGLLEGEWLEGEKLEEKLKEGYVVVDGKLAKGGSASPSTPGTPEGTVTVRAPEPRKTKYKILERGKLTSAERQKMEKDRQDRLKSAEKFLAEKEKEYAGVSWDKRHKIRTTHFEIHCNSTERVARAYGALMEIIRDQLAKMFPSRVLRNLRAAIFIYASQDEFIQRDGQARFAGRGLGGYYNPSTQTVTTYHGTFGFTGTTFSVLSHEGTHYYQGLVLKNFENIPIWLIEGLAVYFGDGSTFDPKTAKIEVGKIPRDRLADIQERLLIKRNTPIEKLITMTRATGFSGMHYADSWALIYFLVNSGDKGQKLLKDYWSIGLERDLTKKDFLGLADKYFGGVKALEAQCIDYILRLPMPPSGQVSGDYFVSDVFQFDFKAPSDEWQFFEDPDDKKMLVGLLLPGTSAEVRVTYRNNFFNAKGDVYLEDYLRTAKLLYKDIQSEPAKISGLKGYKLHYVDEKGESVELSDLGALSKLKAQRGIDEEPEKKKPPARTGSREVIKFLLVQEDGVISIECSAKPSEVKQLGDVFNKMNEMFTLSFTRRW